MYSPSKVLVSLMMGLFLWTVGWSFTPVYAVLGFIDVQRVFTEFKESSKARTELSKKEEEYKKEFEGRQKKLDEAEKGGKAKEELEKMRGKLQEELGPKLEELQGMRAKLSGELQQKIVEAVKEVSKQVGIDVVIDKQAVIAGGTDLTDLVVGRLNKGK